MWLVFMSFATLANFIQTAPWPKSTCSMRWLVTHGRCAVLSPSISLWYSCSEPLSILNLYFGLSCIKLANVAYRHMLITFQCSLQYHRYLPLLRSIFDNATSPFQELAWTLFFHEITSKFMAFNYILHYFICLCCILCIHIRDICEYIKLTATIQWSGVFQHSILQLSYSGYIIKPH